MEHLGAVGLFNVGVGCVLRKVEDFVGRKNWVSVWIEEGWHRFGVVVVVVGADARDVCCCCVTTEPPT